MLLWWPFYEWPFNNHHETSSIIITINNYYCYCYYYNCCCCCCRWWYLLLGLLVLRRYFWSVLQGGTNVITKCDKCHYKVQQVLLQSATSVITKCDKCYYKVRQVLKSATEETSRRSCWCSKPILCSGSWISFLCKRFFCSNKFAEMLAKWAKTLYRTPEERTNFTFL